MTEARRFANACVASPHHVATASGMDVLASGGNALDAAIATNLTLGVVAPYLCGYGGDLFAMVWTEGRVFAYNGSGRAPAAATVESARAAVGGDRMPAFGPHTVTVPGAVEAWFVLLEHFGTRAFADLARPGLACARDGFTPSPIGLASLQRSAQRYVWSAEWQAVYGHVRPGRPLVQPDLARTIGVLGDDGADAYYRGPIAHAIVDHLRSMGGLMSLEDLADHRGDFVEPLRSTYRDVDVLELPPNTQGITALEALEMVSAVGTLPLPGPERQHLLVEAMKLALVDRDAHVTDPDHMRIPPGNLLTADFIRRRVAAFDPGRADHPPAGTRAPGGTAYMCAADRDGMLVSLIQSNWTGFGSGVTVPGWGINLQNRGAFFSLDPEHVNVIAPRKRTMHTLIPGMAFRGDSPWLAFGTMGGDGQAQTHLQLLTRIVDDGADLQEAIDAPRWFVSPSDWSLSAESRFERGVLDGLSDRGHRVQIVEPFDSLMGHAHAIAVADDGFEGATDPRTEGAVLGF